MDTGRISLPSIDCMLNTKSQLNYLQPPSPPPAPPLLTSNANIPSFSQHDQQDSFVCSSSSSSSLSSTIWKSHTRSHSMDVNLAYSTTPSFPQQQQQPSSSSSSSSSFTSLPLPPPVSRFGSSVPPSHERSTRMSPYITTSSTSSSSSLIKRQQQPSWTRTNDAFVHHQHPPLPPRRQHHHHHHQRSTSYTMGMNYNTLGNSNTINLHKMLGDTPPRKYLCPYCTKSFSRPSSLRTHIFSHSGEKPFVCPYQGCHRSFSVQSNMRRHIRVHYSASLASSASSS